ncbi:MAG TPA: hypothetical protein VIR78_01530 [Malonomonas sp.]
MKTTLTALIAALFLFGAPLLATAHDGGQRKGGADRHDRGWERDRHQDRHDFRDRRDHRDSHRRGYRAEKHHRKHEHRRHAHYQRHHRPVYASAPAVIFGAPRIIFRIDW